WSRRSSTRFAPLATCGTAGHRASSSGSGSWRQRGEASVATNGDTNLRRVCGLWKTERNGRQWLSGKARERIVIEPGETIFIFSVKTKKSDRSPSHEVCIAPARDQQDAPPRTARTGPIAPGDEVPF